MIPGALILGFEKRKWLKLRAVGWGNELVFECWIAGILEVWAVFEELLMPHGKLKKHFLSETILCSVYIMHFLLSSVFIKCWLWGLWRGRILWFLNRQKGLLQWEFYLTDACRTGQWELMWHLSPGLIAPGSPAYPNRRVLLGIMIKWGICIRSDCSALKSVHYDQPREQSGRWKWCRSAKHCL